MGNETKDWKLKLRYGKLKTNFCHFTVVADGVAGELVEGFECRPGRAWIAMKTWASDVDESVDMIRAIGSQIGFTVEGRKLIFNFQRTGANNGRLQFDRELQLTSFQRICHFSTPSGDLQKIRSCWSGYYMHSPAG